MDVYIVNEDGFWVDTYSSRKPFDADPDLIITKPWKEGIFTPKFDFQNGEWVEGLSTEEITLQKEKALNDAKPVPTIEKLQIENEKLRSESEMNALAIMELAEIILGG